MANFLFSAFADEAAPDLAGQIAALRRNRIGMVELRGVDGKGVLDLTEAEARAARAQLDAAGIGVSAIGSPIGKIGITDDFRPHFEQFQWAVELAGILGTKRIRMFSFYIPKGDDPQGYFPDVVRRVKAMVEYGEAHGVLCCHENEKGIYGDTLPRVQRLLAAVPGLRCVFDPANYIQCGDDPAVDLAALQGQIDYLHIKDALPASGTVVPAGEGAGHLPEILAALAKEDRTYILTLEPHLFDFPGLGDLQSDALLHRRTYQTPAEAFDAAAAALRKCL